MRKHSSVKRFLAVMLVMLMVVTILPVMSVPVHADPSVPTDSYLTFTGTDAFILKVRHCDGVTLQYATANPSIDSNWHTVTTLNWDISVSNPNPVIYLRGTGNNNKQLFNINNHLSIISEGTVACSGNIMTLLDHANPNQATMVESCFNGMFYNCTKLTTAPALPATTLISRCYQEMFRGCTGLTTAPVLPATTLASHCYGYMFHGCTGLKSAPALPATSLVEYCYVGMFKNCTGLTTAPVLPATTLASDCYESMFYGCTGLTTAPVLPATTLASACYEYMFYGCTGLTTAPVLPATSLAENCYGDMFYGCTGLKSAPALPATSLAEYCYSHMFYGCTGIKLSTTGIGEYTSQYRIPSSGTGSSAEYALEGMFAATGGTFTGTPVFENPYYMVPDYLTFTAEEDESSVKINLCDGTLQYSQNGVDWNVYTSGAEITLNKDEYVLFRGKNNNKQLFDYYKHVMITGKIACSGNIMTILDYEHPYQATMGSSCFSYMFRDCQGLTTAPALPATTLAYACYSSMFDRCTNLTTTPALPATTLADWCYSSMFKGCTNLTTAPALPATTLADACYSGMFECCTGLTTAPTLPATTLKDYCYFGMFSGCTGIKLSTTQTGDYTAKYIIPSPGVGTTANYALNDMFTGTGGTFTGTPYINAIYYMDIVSARVPTIIAQPTDLTLNYGATSGNILHVEAAAASGHNLSYQWYSNTTNSNEGGTAITNATGSSYTIPFNTPVGTTYYYCVITAKRADNQRTASVVSDTAAVYIKLENPAVVNDTAAVIRGGNTVDLANNITMNGATGTVGYAISGEAIGCSLNGSVLTSGTDTGSLTVNVTVAEDTNYTALAATPITVTVNEKQLQTITASDITATFGDTDKAVGASVTDPVTGSGAISYAVKTGSEDYIEVDASTGALTIKKVPANGKAYVTVTADETTTYAQATKDVTVTIDSKAMTVNAEDVIVFADGQPHGITVNVTDPASGATVKYGTEDGNYTLDESPAQTEVGTKTVYYQVTADNYTTYTGSANVTVTAKQLQTITASDITATFGDTDKAVSASVTDPATGSGAISYAVKTGSEAYIEVDASTGALTIKKVPANGKAYVTVTAAETATYAHAIKDVTITINKANAVASNVTVNSLTFDGTEKPLVTVDNSALVGGEMQYTLGNATEATGTYSTSIPAATDAGTYYVWYKVSGDENHNDVQAVKADVEIKKASQEIPDVSAVDETVSGNNDGKINGLSNKMEISTDKAPADFMPVTDVSGTGYAPGTYYVRYAADANHNASDVKKLIIKVGESDPEPDPSDDDDYYTPSYPDYIPPKKDTEEPKFTPGTKKTVTENPDGSVTTVTTVTGFDGKVTEITVTEGKNGKKDTKEVVTDKDGNVLSIMTEKVRFDKNETKIVTTVIEKADGYSLERKESTYKNGTVVTETTEITPKKTTKYIKETKKKNGSVKTESVETKADGKTTLKSSAKGTDDIETVKVYSVKEDGTVRLEYLITGKKTAIIPATVTFNGVTYEVNSIAKGAFEGNTTLKTVKIGPNILYIGAGAFDGAENLKNIFIDVTNLKKVFMGAFDGISPKAKFNLTAPDKKTFRRGRNKLRNSGVPKSMPIKWEK